MAQRAGTSAWRYVVFWPHPGALSQVPAVFDTAWLFEGSPVDRADSGPVMVPSRETVVASAVLRRTRQTPREVNMRYGPVPESVIRSSTHADVGPLSRYPLVPPLNAECPVSCTVGPKASFLCCGAADLAKQMLNADISVPGCPGGSRGSAVVLIVQSQRCGRHGWNALICSAVVRLYCRDVVAAGDGSSGSRSPPGR